jgi:hypothetical protein
MNENVKEDLDIMLRFANTRQAGYTLYLLQQAQLPSLASSATRTLPDERRQALEQYVSRWTASKAATTQKSPL